MDKSLKLAWLFPSTLYLHGERGNILAFEKLAKENNINLETKIIELDDDFDPLDFDIIYCPAGETIQAESVIKKLKNNIEALNEFINLGRPFIVTGNSICFFGKNLIRTNQEKIDGLNLLDFTSVEKEAPYGDDIYFKTNYNNKELEILGNQIQLNDLDTKSNKAFGELIYGYGNNGNDKNEGFCLKNSIFTNTLGPLFVLNPWLTIEVLNVALENKNFEPINQNDPFDLEKKSLQAKVNYIKNKKSDLKNT